MTLTIHDLIMTLVMYLSLTIIMMITGCSLCSTRDLPQKIGIVQIPIRYVFIAQISETTKNPHKYVLIIRTKNTFLNRRCWCAVPISKTVLTRTLFYRALFENSCPNLCL